ncbi:hypothetical protein SLU01_16620 [Sporosarcina luteola]|uniref:Diphthamide synthase domain-containing protein n=1 Tax=Sporosarcina luteola TaxID=582850 RepID=A0A511Z7E8_9BACL|nr:diphthine--ammonia ligase [Sporosarcina luteola]GEN83350.1 hypothetical protein SLU01_16620 [Sporosarcina luteola]
MRNKPFVASWSGGKDSALAYYRALQSGGVPKRVWTMFEEDKERSKSHALPIEIVRAQADSLDVPLMIRGADWNGYEAKFLDAMRECVEAGIPNGVFGDIDLEDHLTWVQTACAKVGMDAIHPLWMEPRRKLLEEFVNAGFEAYIIVVNTKMMPAEFIGRKFTIELMDELDALGIDSCGESGEFHTVVVDGPIFKNRVPIVFEEQHERNGYVFVSVGLEGQSLERAVQLFEEDRFEEAEKIFHERLLKVSDEQEEQYILHWLGFTLAMKGVYTEARDCYERLLLTAKEEEDLFDEAIALHQLGMVYRLEKNYQKSLDLFTQEKELWEKEMPNHHVGFSANAYELGLIALLENRLDDSSRHFDEALRRAELADDWMCIGCAMRGKGQYFEAVKELEKAKRAFLGSIEAFEKVGETKGAREVRGMVAPYL